MSEPTDPSSTPTPSIERADTIVGTPVPRPDSDTLDATGEGSSLPASVDAAATPLEERGFGERYEARRLLGTGGMGEVRLCKDRRIGREVAIKVMRARPGSRGDALERFVREARVQGQLEHPAIVPVYDLGAGADGAPFFTMKRVRGLTLEDLVAGLRENAPGFAEKYTRRRLLTAFSTVCLAVDFAHARGVLHRDLKPGNVMLGDFGEVNVLDWGLAKIAGVAESSGNGDDAPRVEVPDVEGGARTHHGAVLGTPGYMAPEQVLGQIDKLDARTDVYALGTILFELLSYQPLFDQPTMSGQLLATIAGQQVAKPSARAPRLDIAPELDAICLRATALDPSARYPSARALSDAIERYLDGDRDLSRRRELAAEHAGAAQRAAESARTSHGETSRTARALAMREVTRALAFDPEHRGALGTLARLMLDVPDELPPEAAAELAASAALTRREAARVSAIRYLTWVGFIPLCYLMGARSWLAGIVTMASLVVSSLGAYVLYRRGNVTVLNGLWILGASSVAVGWIAALFGPFILGPGLASTNTMFFAMYADRPARRVIALAGLLTMLLPWAAELVGLVPPSYGFHDAVLVIYPRMTDFPPGRSLFVLLASSAAMIVTPTFLVGRMRDALAAAERRLFVRSWHLRQMLPEEARVTVQPETP